MNVFIDPCSSVVKSPQTSASVETEDGSGLPGLGGAGAMVRAKCHDCCQRMVEWSLPPVRHCWATGGASYVHSKKGSEGVGALGCELGCFPTGEASIWRWFGW